MSEKKLFLKVAVKAIAAIVCAAALVRIIFM